MEALTAIPPQSGLFFAKNTGNAVFLPIPAGCFYKLMSVRNKKFEIMPMKSPYPALIFNKS
jgi:hypothetical protein